MFLVKNHNILQTNDRNAIPLKFTFILLVCLLKIDSQICCVKKCMYRVNSFNFAGFFSQRVVFYSKFVYICFIWEIIVHNAYMHCNVWRMLRGIFQSIGNSILLMADVCSNDINSKIPYSSICWTGMSKSIKKKVHNNIRDSFRLHLRFYLIH